MRVNIILLVIAHLICETAEVFERLWPSLAIRKIDPFINYSWPWPDQPLQLQWWIKYCTDSIFNILVFIVLVRATYAYSRRLFTTAVLLLCYHLIDYFMLWYNYRTGHALYWAMGFTMIGCVASMFLKEDKEARIFSIR